MQNFILLTSTIWRVCCNFLFSLSDFVIQTGFPLSRSLNIDPGFGQCAVIVLSFNLISAKIAYIFLLKLLVLIRSQNPFF